MSLMRYLYAQFAQPRGRLGEVVGWILAMRRSNRRRARWTLSLLDIQPGDALLDVGCGPGVGLQIALASTPAASVAGLDHSEAMLNQARRRLASRQVEGRVELLHGSIGDPMFGGRRFDRICSMNVIQFVPNQADSLAALKALLKPGGRLATTYQPRGKKPKRDAAVAMAEDLTGILQRLGFINVRVEVLEMSTAPAVCVLGDVP